MVMDMSTQFWKESTREEEEGGHGMTADSAAATASALHANCFMAKRNWFNNKFNLSLSIF